MKTEVTLDFIASCCRRWVVTHPTRSTAWLIYGQCDRTLHDFIQSMVALDMCQSPKHLDACGHCQGCRWQQAGSHPDMHTVALKEGKHQIGIDDIRLLVDRLSRKCTTHARHMVWIQHAQCLSVPAANALLKVIEESPSQVIFWLQADSEKALLPTLRSRCFQLHLPTSRLSCRLSKISQHTKDDDDDPIALLGDVALLEIAADTQSEKQHGLVALLRGWEQGRWCLPKDGPLDVTDALHFLMASLYVLLLRSGTPSVTKEHAVWLLYQQCLQLKDQLKKGVVLHAGMLLGHMAPHQRALQAVAGRIKTLQANEILHSLGVAS